MRRPELDGLRGLAVLLVLLSHSSNQGLFLAPGLDFRGLGRSGVFLFFVLSSFLLTDQLLGRGAAGLREGATWRRYAARRLLRVYPGYLLALGVTLALGGMTLRHAGEHVALVRAEGHFWTIPVEVLFYLALPPLAFVLTAAREPLRQLALLAGLVLAAWLAFPPDYPARAPDFRPSVLPFLPVFLVGSALAVVVRVDRWRPPRTLAPAALGGLVLLAPAVASIALGERVEHTRFHLWFLPHSLLWAAVLFGVLRHGGALARAASWAPLRWLGLASYSVYLLHAVALAWVLERGPDGVAGAWTFLALGFALGGASFLLVERPFMRLPMRGDRDGDAPTGTSVS